LEKRVERIDHFPVRSPSETLDSNKYTVWSHLVKTEAGEGRLADERRVGKKRLKTGGRAESEDFESG